MGKNVAAARHTVAELAGALPDPAKSRAHGALAAGGAIMTARDRVPPATLARLEWLVGKYIH
jgi:hypothetical protein